MIRIIIFRVDAFFHLHRYHQFTPNVTLNLAGFLSFTLHAQPPCRRLVFLRHDHHGHAVTEIHSSSTPVRRFCSPKYTFSILGGKSPSRPRQSAPRSGIDAVATAFRQPRSHVNFPLPFHPLCGKPDHLFLYQHFSDTKIGDPST